MKTIHLQEIILITLIGIIFGFIYIASDTIYNILTLVLTPIGYGPLANDLTMGIWCMAGPLAGFLIKKPGAAFLGEFLSSCIETFIMAEWGIANLISGFMQGIGNELGFALTGYRYYNTFTLFLSATTTAIVTYLYDFFKNGYNYFSTFNIWFYFLTRWSSMVLFSCLFVKLIINLLEKAHVINQD
ncbi:ECF transporter S component [Lactobacillus rodentium]|uniref:Energy-coupling factor transporter substrate-binding protein n=1 Tax=Lactobacillus rodentium TaxID=947835 RepID=A0A2Z6TB47_9LACO|nr:ECF transporter S component [Lactobacillus rodentium]MCR1894943.1 ECF transporter S component [Lactobacillus rodentium]GBG05213.1 energy-coupling factor transporter substrate-binding protein [Lactobacillus rodentium]